MKVRKFTKNPAIPSRRDTAPRTVVERENLKVETDRNGRQFVRVPVSLLHTPVVIAADIGDPGQAGRVAGDLEVITQDVRRFLSGDELVIETSPAV